MTHAHDAGDQPAVEIKPGNGIFGTEIDLSQYGIPLDVALKLGFLVGEMVRRAEERTGKEAIEALRDRERWAQWCAGRVIIDGGQRIDVRQPTDAADYLEAIHGQR